ncbi:MAG: hypothetical protein AAB268_02915 [Elusimicrobiota bacterium]
MEQRTIRLNFDLSFVYGPRTWRLPIMAAMLLASVGELNSESVVLTTYYPAPSGVYTSMITTGSTILARNSNSVVINSLGTAPVSNANLKLGVNGGVAVGSYWNQTAPTPANGLIVSGRVGVGIATPATALHVVGHTYINASGCSSWPITTTSADGIVCMPGSYATFQPGVYIEGTTYNYLPLPRLTDSGGTVRKFAGMTAASLPVAMPISYDPGIKALCCPK